jgi:PTH1 family peptidyl-tRNA hydrolase
MAGKSYLVAGLGNIGSEYALSRHNMGFMALDAWAKESGAVFRSERYGDIANLTIKGRQIYLLKPSTYMNLSGKAVRYWMGKLPVTEERLMVICDDINLPFGTLRLRKSGSDGGHNGLKNIEECLETNEFPRLRMGVGRDFHEGEQVDFVLGPLDPQQLTAMPELCKKMAEGLEQWIFLGIDKAMNFINTQKKEEKP